MRFGRLLFFAISPVLLGQTGESAHVFHFQHATNAQQMQEAATAIRSIGTIPMIAVSDEDRTFTIAGTPAQVSFVDWIFPLLDVDPRTPAVHDVAGDHLFGGDPNDAVRLLRIGNAANVQSFQEMATGIRSITQLRNVYTDNSSRYILLRGQPADLQLGQWLAEQLDRVPGAPREVGQLALTGEQVAIIRATSPKSVADFQEMVTAVRSVGEIRMVYTYNPDRCVLIRSSESDLDLARWLLTQLDQPSAGAAAQYPKAKAGEAVMVLFLPSSGTVAEFQKNATNIRVATGIRRLYVYNRLRAVLVRDTPARVAQAQKIVDDLIAAVK